MPGEKHHCYSSVEMHTHSGKKKQQKPSAQVIYLPLAHTQFLAKPTIGSGPTGMDHAPRKERQGVAFPTRLKAPDPRGCTVLSSCGPPHPGELCLQDAEGQGFAFPRQTLFHHLPWASATFISTASRSGTMREDHFHTSPGLCATPKVIGAHQGLIWLIPEGHILRGFGQEFISDRA